jgi:hypothetical protein
MLETISQSMIKDDNDDNSNNNDDKDIRVSLLGVLVSLSTNVNVLLSFRSTLEDDNKLIWWF